MVFVPTFYHTHASILGQSSPLPLRPNSNTIFLDYFINFVTHFVSHSGHVMSILLFILSEHQWNTKPFHFKKAPYYVTIATVIFSHLKITFRVKSYHVSTLKVTWYITDVYIMKIFICLTWLICLLTRETNSNHLYLNLMSSKCNHGSANRNRLIPL